MSYSLFFNILPYNPLIEPDSPVQLSIDLYDLAHQLREKWSDGEIVVWKGNDGTVIRLYVPTVREGLWNIAQFSEPYSHLVVEVWPEPISRELILWYRRYVPTNDRLYIFFADDIEGIIELTPETTPDDIGTLCPFPIPKDE